jgi:hypothetical protein
MSKIESRIGIIPSPDVKVFNFLSDFTNFSNLIPPVKISNWSATHDSCSFIVEGIGHAGLKILEKIPNYLIKISSDSNTPLNFYLWIDINSKSTNLCEVKITVEPNVNPLILGMIKTPLQGFVDMLVDQMEKLRFS